MQNFSGVYGITDPKLTPANSLFEQVEQALRGGMRILQYRNKMIDQSLHTQRHTALGLKEICHQYDCLFFINDNLALARQVRPDGIHLGQQDHKIDAVKQALGRAVLLGVSCHNSLQFAHKAQAEGADYVAFGRFFPSQSKPHAPPAQLNTLIEAKQSLTIPVVAIGGITLENAAEPIDRGADMVALIEGLFGADNIQSTCRNLSLLFNQSE